MSISKKLIFGAVFFLMLSVLVIGYAQLSDTLTVSGSASAESQKGVFIYDVVVPSGVNVTVNAYAGTVLNSEVALGASGTSTATVTVKLHNNSNFPYKFNGTTYTQGTDTYSNSNIKFAHPSLVKGDEIQPHGDIVFDLAFAYNNQSNITSTVLTSVLNFEFILSSEYIDDYTSEIANDRFEEILNTTIDFDKLITQMNNHNNSDRADQSYIGNVVGASDGDSALINELFTVNGENLLTLEINGVKTPVTAMIKKENVDGNSTNGSGGDEMTLYMTADDISKLPWYGGKVTVFAAVYTKDTADGEWYQLGEIFEGEADSNAYDGGWFSTDDSFNTDTWESTVKYYNVNAGASIETIVKAIPKE